MITASSGVQSGRCRDQPAKPPKQITTVTDPVSQIHNMLPCNITRPTVVFP